MLSLSLPAADDVPPALLAQHNWLTWRAERRGERITKLPVSPRTGRLASSTDSATWTTFAAAASFAVRERCDGVGFVFTATPFVGIDLDHCLDLTTGELAPWAVRIMERFATYTEISPSGTGLHLILRGTLPAGGRKRPAADGASGGAVEVYDDGRYFTFTGRRWPSMPLAIEDRHDELQRWYAEAFPQEQEREVGQFPPPAPHNVSDGALVRLASNAQNGSLFASLWAGRWQDTHASQSEADLALCNLLAFWAGGDARRVDALFRQSGLLRPKWDERHRGDGRTYGQLTVEKALASTTDYYEGPALEVDTRKETKSRTTVLPAPEPAEWIGTPDPAALYGLAGDVVQACDPHTEADAAGILGQFLAAFANVVGPSPHVVVGATKHRAILNVAIVGRSSRARKGDSWQYVSSLISRADPDWAMQCVTTGLSTGEGLIHAVRDPSGDDESVRDRRALIVETEFGRTLRVMARDGNTLSAVLRDAWDGRDLRVMTRGMPLRATGAHVGIIGHITLGELRRELSSTDATNGFANRFDWFCVRRSKALDDPPPLPDATRGALVDRIRDALDTSRHIGVMARDEECRLLWKTLYPTLTLDQNDLAGEVLSRSEAQVLRLSIVYALLDGSAMIRRAHLEAALAVWDYCAASVRYVFGSALNDALADEILRQLQTAGEMTRSEIGSALSRHQSSARIQVALSVLEANGQAAKRLEKTGGRPVEIWSCTGKQTAASVRLLDALRGLFAHAQNGVIRAPQSGEGAFRANALFAQRDAKRQGDTNGLDRPDETRTAPDWPTREHPADR